MLVARRHVEAVDELAAESGLTCENSSAASPPR
jgi:hypothetical protein